MEISSVTIPVAEIIQNDSKPKLHNLQVSSSKSEDSFQRLIATDENNHSENSGLSKGQNEKIIHEFSVVLTQQFLGSLIEKEISSVAGDSVIGDFQASIFIKAVSENLAKTDALGLNALVADKIKDG